MPALLFEIRDHIAYLTINRPEVHNAMNPEVVVRMAEAWQRVAADDDVRAAIITGAGNKAFSAGADLARMIPLMTGARQPEDEWDHKIKEDPKIGAVAMLRGWSLYKPVIAAVNGFLHRGRPRVDAGDRSARRGRVGELRPAGGQVGDPPRRRLAGAAGAPDAVLQGDGNSSHRQSHRSRRGLAAGAHQLRGAQQDVMAKAEELAHTIAENGPLAVRAIKETVEKCSGLPFEAAFKIENEAQRFIRKTEDAREGPRAFIEKRKPNYKGR